MGTVSWLSLVVTRLPTSQIRAQIVAKATAARGLTEAPRERNNQSASPVPSARAWLDHATVNAPEKSMPTERANSRTGACRPGDATTL
jgi:hypothetical protein